MVITVITLKPESITQKSQAREKFTWQKKSWKVYPSFPDQLLRTCPSIWCDGKDKTGKYGCQGVPGK